MSLRILDVADCLEEAVFLVFWLSPFLCQHLRSKKLGGALPDDIVMVSCEHVICSPTVVTGRMRCGVRQRCVVEGAFSSRCKKRRECFAQPQSSENVHGGIRARGVRFGINHWNIGRQTIVTPNLHD